jgi:hypothetical protein
MNIQKATRRYESWLAGHVQLVKSDLRLKHERMREAAFLFLRATFYRWAQVWPLVCRDLVLAPAALAVGDLHIENFGTWRDAEGRLAWGVNDFDEACWLPYTNDLVRLGTSACLAIKESRLAIGREEAVEAVLEGYSKAIENGGQAFVLAEEHEALRAVVAGQLKDPAHFWKKLDALAALKKKAVPVRPARVLRGAMPEPRLLLRIVRRVAGVGSLGRQRFVALADHQGGSIAREAKAMAPSALFWSLGREDEREILYRKILRRAIRSADPHVALKGRWLVRRLAPDCTKSELSELPVERDEVRLLTAMGHETANVHLGNACARDIRRDLARRPSGWLLQAVERMVQSVSEDWDDWRKRKAG